MTDDNDRMDRARRIREMREGSRPDAQADDPDAEADADDGPASEATDGGSDDPAATADADDPAADGPPAAGAGGDSATADAPAAEPTADAPDAEAGNSAGAESPAADSQADEAADPDDPPDGAVDPDDRPADATGDDGSTMHIPGAEVGDVTVDVEELAEQAGIDASDVDAGDLAEAPEAGEEVAGVGMAGARGAEANAGSTSDETRVLEFDLGDERYCLDIEYVEEIVKRETVTRVPNTPDYVEGVVDLRGQITTILDPKVLLDIDAEGSKELIVVFDPERFEDQGAIGWVVDDVNQVTPIADDEVNDSPVDQDGINGVVDRDGEFVIWTTPEVSIDEAAG